MKTLTITELKSKIARVLEQASAGESIAVTRRGKNIFVFNQGDVMVTRRIVPHEKTRTAIDALRKQQDRYSHGESVTQALDAVRYRNG
jgi:antitoxin (DNA-binding transcriptional repressor) of toxin-antitoxin stability system